MRLIKPVGVSLIIALVATGSILLKKLNGGTNCKVVTNISVDLSFPSHCDEITNVAPDPIIP